MKRIVDLWELMDGIVKLSPLAGTYISPTFFVICKVIHAHRFSRLPVPAYQLFYDDRVAKLDIDLPFFEPTGAICSA
jgi:hypothetical protein